MVAKKNLCRLLIVILLVFNTAGAALAGDEINMNFKKADINDVLRTIAELAGVNLITDGSVQGTVTVHLKNISFKEAIELITQTQHLAYRWNGSNVVVATPERIEEIYGSITSSVVNIEYADLNAIKQITTGLYPDLNIQLDYRNNKVILQGKKEEIAQAIVMIRRLDQPSDNITESVIIKTEEIGQLEKLVQDFYPALKLGLDRINNRIFISGSKKDVTGALVLIEKVNKAPAPETEFPVAEIEIVRVRYNDLAKVKEYVSSLYPQLKVQVDEFNSQLLLSGQKNEINKAVTLIRRVDIEPEDEKIETIKLVYADPDSISDQLERVLPAVKLQVARNNHLIISGKEEEMKKAVSLIKKLDNAPEKEVFEAVALSYMEPSVVAEQISDIFPTTRALVNDHSGQLLLFGKRTEVDHIMKLVERLDIRGNNKTEVLQLVNTDQAELTEKLEQISSKLDVEIEEFNGEVIISGREEAVKRSVSFLKEMEDENKQLTDLFAVNYLDPDELKKILAGLYPDLKLQINQMKRQLIVTGKEARVKDVASFMEKIDRPRRQVIIEARFEEISRSQLKNMGIYPDRLGQIEFIKDGQGVDGLSINWPGAINALEKSGHANTLANPRLMTLNGEEARLLIGDRIPVLVEKVEDGEATRTIQYIEAGITLQFKPWITDDNYINLEVKPKVSSIGKSVGTGLPPINTREVETKVQLKDGETFAIGGLIQDDIIENVSRIPLLSQIPVLGELFKQRHLNKMKTELIILITPHIVGEDLQYPWQNAPLPQVNQKKRVNM